MAKVFILLFLILLLSLFFLVFAYPVYEIINRNKQEQTITCEQLLFRYPNMTIRSAPIRCLSRNFLTE